MNKTQCPHSESLHPFMDEELPEESKRLFERHLASCRLCSDELTSLQKLKGLLHDLDDVTVSMDFDRKFWKKVDAFEEKKRSSFFGGWLARRWRYGLTPLLASLILFGGVTMIKKYQNAPFDDMKLVEQMDLFADYDVVNNLDLLEQMDNESLSGEH